MSSSNLVLPFSVEDSGRKKRFSADMEVAALLCLAEAERKKKPGILGGAAETLIFLSKLYYPLWLIPWQNDCFVIDGMETVSNSIMHFKLPDVEAFVEHLKSSTTVQELYRSALRSHAETFTDFTSRAEIPVEGFAADKEFLSDVLEFVRDSKAEVLNTIRRPAALIQPRTDMANAVRIGEKIQECYNRLQSEMKSLQFAIDYVTTETELHVKKLQQEMEQTHEKYKQKISIVEAQVAKRREELQIERDEKMERITKANEKEVNSRLEERKKWEQELAMLKQDKSEYEKRRELRKQKKDEIGETRWNTRLRDVQNRISTMKGKIKVLTDFINRSNREAEKTMKSIRNRYQRLIEEEEKKITVLEHLRDSEVEELQNTIEEVRHETLIITDKIEKLTDQKKEHVSLLKEATISWKTEIPGLVHLPLYLMCFKAENQVRYRVYPPVVARGHEGLVMKIRKRMKSYSLQSKIGALLKIRSKALERMLLTFEEKINVNKAVQQGLGQLNSSRNLLASLEFKDRARKGMEKLEAEGWIKPEEKAAILAVYAKN